MSGYGQGFNDPKGMNFVPGVNEGVVLTKFEVVDVNTANYNGKALDIVWSKDGDEINCRAFPVNEDNIRVREDETREEAIDKAYREFNSWMKHLGTAYEHLLPEDKQGKFVEEYVKATSFETACQIVRSFIPKNPEKYTGKLLVGYDNKGFLKVPTAMWITGYFWSVDGSDKELKIGKYLRITRPVQQEQSKTTDTPATDTEW